MQMLSFPLLLEWYIYQLYNCIAMYTTINKQCISYGYYKSVGPYFFLLSTGEQSGVSNQKRFENLDLPITTAESLCLGHPKYQCIHTQLLFAPAHSSKLLLKDFIKFYFQVIVLIPEIVIICVVHLSVSRFQVNLIFEANVVLYIYCFIEHLS